MAVPYTFGSATTSIPLSQLDSNFATTITLGNTAIQLGNTVTTLNNMTLANATVSSGNATVTTLTAPTHNSASSLTFQTNGTTTAITVDTSQNVGIGTASPSQKLEVAGNALLSNNQYFGVKDSTGAATGFPIFTGSNDAIFGYLASGTTGINTYQFRTGNNAERMRIDSSGNVGIGTSSPTKRLQVESGSTATGGQAWSHSSGTVYARIGIVNPGTSNDTEFGTVTNNNLRVIINNTETARFDTSGNLLVGTTSGSTPNPGVVLNPGTNSAIQIGHGSGAVSGSSFAVFKYNGTDIGYIEQNGTTGVLYKTSSDYRLKTVIGSVADAGQRIDALQPVEYEWKSDGSRTRGFLAHQFQEVYASSVSGTKDAVDAEGKPVYQSMQASSSEVIADLVSEIQSLRKRLLALETK
jgi:hypothetical protein